MAQLKWDHVVHYVNDLDKGIQVFEELGLSAFRGGSHAKWGTFNALSYFGLFYVEFLGIERPEYARSPEDPNLLVEDAIKFLPAREIFGRIALRTDDIEAVAASLTEKGASISPIVDGKRLNAQGQLIEWRMLMINGNFNGLVYPFVIQWNGSDADRLKAMTEVGVIQPHRAGGIQVESAVFEVQDPIEAAAQWQQLFGFPPVEQQGDGSVILLTDGQSFIFEKGDKNNLTRIIFRTSSPNLIGTTLKIGDGQYVFK
ncbi:VOC family protein [Bacillus sp. FJAT-27445]|uniref:VOC family protein n=1 Tax=Bacillus sp. FJAT-27445 TaxID=1679166 RepID=UPI0007442134|nr:VOC family protein [Bacillus sp. FJAT-27445]